MLRFCLPRISNMLPSATLVLLACFSPLALALDLLESYQFALVEDAQYRAAQAIAEGGREVLPMARAQLYPNVSANASHYHNDLNSQTENILGQTQSTDSSYPSTSYALTLRQPLYRPAIYAGYQQAKSKLSSVEAVLDKAGQDLAQRVAAAYLTVLQAQAEVESVVLDGKAISAQLIAATKAMKAGFGTRTDIDDAQARLDMNQAKELAARQQIEQAMHDLQVLINRPVAAVKPLDSKRLELRLPQPDKLEDWIQRAESNNPELRDVNAQLQAGRLDVDRARAGHKPTLDLIVQRSLSESDNVTNPGARYLNDQIGLQLNLPLYSGGYVSAQVRQAVASQTDLKERREAVRRKLANDVRKQFQAIQQGILKVRALEQADRSADQAVLSNEKGFMAGTRSRVDILNAEQQRGSTRLDLARERLNYVMAHVRLLGLGGALNLDEVAALNRWLADQPVNQI